jgi:Rieske Fe-S protein
MSDEDQKQPGEKARDDSRRTFLKVGVGAVGAGVACISAAPAVGYVLFPLDAQVTSGGEEFVVVGKRKMFNAETPVKVDVYADVKDAWNRQKNVRLGSCWVIERDGDLVAFSTTCPHLGCAIDFDPEATKFKCPCHRSAFSIEGKREEGPSPRDMDELSLKDEDGLVMVMYQRFKQGLEDKELA